MASIRMAPMKLKILQIHLPKDDQLPCHKEQMHLWAHSKLENRRGLIIKSSIPFVLVYDQNCSIYHQNGHYPAGAMWR